MEDLAVTNIVKNGIGLVPPEKVDRMYEGLHSHLQSVGIDGVKIDFIHVINYFPTIYHTYDSSYKVVD